MQYLGIIITVLAFLMLIGCQGTQSYRGDGFEITYPSNEKAFAKKIVSETEFPIAMGDVEAFNASAAGWKQSDLDLIAHFLGLEERSEQMVEGFDKFTRLFKAMMDVSVIDIYRVEVLGKKLLRGQRINGIWYDQGTEEVHYPFGIRESRGAISSNLRLAVVLDGDDRKDIRSRMTAFSEAVEVLRQVYQPFDPYFWMLHEAVEIEIVFSMIRSPDRRWFADGMANAISLLVLKNRNPESTLKDLLAVHYPPPDGMEEVVDSIDLASWKAAENETSEDPAGAYYHLATLAVLRMIEENGEDFIPRLFRELRMREYKTNDMQTIYEIFQDQTGINMRSYFQKAKQDFLENRRYNKTVETTSYSRFAPSSGVSL